MHDSPLAIFFGRIWIRADQQVQHVYGLACQSAAGVSHAQISKHAEQAVPLADGLQPFWIGFGFNAGDLSHKRKTLFARQDGSPVEWIEERRVASIVKAHDEVTW